MVDVERFDVAVIGGGLLGLATALRLLRDRPSLKLGLLEKEPGIAHHQSGRNSGVLHAGLYYTPGSLKAKLCREGRAELIAFADEHRIPYRLDGKLVVATNPSELDRLDALLARGRANGLRGIEEVDESGIREIEPNVRGIKALHVPESGVIDYRSVAGAYRGEIERAGGVILLGRCVAGIEERSDSVRLVTAQGSIEAQCAIACTGVWSDRVAALTGSSPNTYRIVPFRGDYYTFSAEAARLVRALVYPVPDPAFPFLGVHFTRGIDGGLRAGPNAVPALAREGYRRFDLSLRDLRETVSFPGFRKLARSYVRTGAEEIWRDLVKPAAIRQMRRYVPAIRGADASFGPSGIRAQCLSVNGTLVDDFLFVETARTIHVLNAPSPAATASMAIGRQLANKLVDRFTL